MTPSERILDIAERQLGMVEYPPNSNNVIYNTEYYEREVSGSNLDWCAVFIWWVFRKAGLSHLYYDGEKTAYVPALVDWATKKGLTVGTPEPGDLVCFDFNNNNRADHIGICVSYDGKRVTTIDGNTGVGNEANGGAVMTRTRDEKYIVCVIHPQYETEADEVFDPEKLTDKQVEALADRLVDVLKKKEPSNWSEEAREWAEGKGIINGDENGDKQYKKFCTREEVIQLMFNAEH